MEQEHRMRAGRRALVGLLVISALLLVSAPAAKAATESATYANLTAQLSYTGSSFNAKNLGIAIIRNGSVLLDQQPQPICNFCDVLPGGFGDRPSVHAVQLDATPDPEAVFDLYTGGAHCCFYSKIFRYEPATNAYIGLTHEWFNAGYRFIDPENDGLLEFRTRDDRFAYKFAAFAFSQYPPQVWRYRAGQMLDVTRQYQAIVRQSAREQRRKYRRLKGRADVRAILAAYVADQCLLGSCSRGFMLVREARRRDYLGKQSRYEFGPHGGKFVRRLRSFLHNTGYL
jgi:hypothetical protein